MSEQPAAKAGTPPAATPKPPKKLVPRTAPKADGQAPGIAAATAVEKPAAAAVETAVEKAVEQAVEKPGEKTVKAVKAAKPPRKPAKIDESAAQRRQVLAEALVDAQAIKYDQPPTAPGADAKPKKAAKVAKVGKGESAPKARKPKLVRDSYAMPEAEYARIGELKKRLAALGVEIKKSELLRAGILLLAALNDDELKAVAGRVERIKTGRPAKK